MRWWPLILVALLAVATVAFALSWYTPDEPHENVRVAGGDASRASAAIGQLGCGTCHTIPGIKSANGGAGPPLIRWSERSYIAGRLPNTPANLVRWIRDPQAIEPGTAMPDLGASEGQARDIAAYLYTLGDRERFDR